MARFYQPTDMPTMMNIMNKKWRLMASFFCLLLPAGLTYAADPAVDSTTVTTASQPDTRVGFTPFEANYQIFRSGKKHGEATRYLSRDGEQYQLGYHSKISWFVFKDERKEQSRFVVEQGRIKPLFYLMQRTGTGPSRHYELNLDWANQQLRVDKNKTLKQVSWNAQWLDLLSFHQQIVLDLAAGKTDFVYDVLNRHGENRQYKYKATGEEWLALPYGKIKAIKIERYGQSPDKQVIAWIAPELGHVLVRLWQSEDNVEQFDVQLSSYQQK